MGSGMHSSRVTIGAPDAIVGYRALARIGLGSPKRMAPLITRMFDRYSVEAILDREVCDRARLARDPRFDGMFFTCVKTTKIYCRPICPSAHARQSNIFLCRVQLQPSGWAIGRVSNADRKQPPEVRFGKERQRQSVVRCD
jgi:hypothetical protein